MKAIFKLCKGEGCCPEFFEDKFLGKFIITDDYFGSVQLSKEQLVILYEKLGDIIPAWGNDG